MRPTGTSARTSARTFAEKSAVVWDPEIILAAVTDRLSLMKAAAAPTGTVEQILAVLSIGTEGERSIVAHYAIRNGHTERRFLERIATDPAVTVREPAASCPAMPTHLLRGLAADPESSVRKRVALNSVTPATTRLRLSWDPDPEVVACIARGALPRWRINELAEHPHTAVRKRVARRRDLTKSLMENLSRDSDPEVRAALAVRPTTVRITRRLALDPDPLVRRGLLGGASIRAEVVAMIQAIPSVKVRCDLLRDPAISLEALRRFRHDPDPRVRAVFEERRHEPLPSYSAEEILRW
jgi:hypothetical protein